MPQWAEQYPDVHRTLPSEPRELEKLHRQYVANVIFTIAGDAFQKWISSVVEQRNQGIKDDQNLDVEMDPEVFKVFQSSTAVTQ